MLQIFVKARHVLVLLESDGVSRGEGGGKV